MKKHLSFISICMYDVSQEKFQKAEYHSLSDEHIGNRLYEMESLKCLGTL